MKGKQKQKKKKRNRKTVIVCNFIGAVLLMTVILLCIPLTLPRFFGYQIYTVISGSMEPAISTGSLVYVREEEAARVQKGEVIAFHSHSGTGTIVLHRVVKNQVVSGQFITKGDANQAEDMEPVPYEYLVGKVTMSIPLFGKILSVLVTLQGKITAASMVALAVILHIIAQRAQEEIPVIF